MTALPDPTIDLDWSGFRGAIHDIFAVNAARHPDRPCVIETASSAGPERVFSYAAINEAANLLAHFLVHHGIERGDVVMVYAYRGVDLVVAVMGVLRAGATFSVIDPLYPPDRQKIYLEVAQPKALINIKKATLEAGPLSAVVRSYINESLQLKAEVPALCIHDGGHLTGGSLNGSDVLDVVRSRSQSSPNVVVGPDSNPTLSFTSGSEGRPKGVLGRHYSLAYYFPWMHERFHLTENDRFTMLSGIAHDPIQRDIFTPLFLGAQLLVPAKEDIQHERLAEWMRKFGATVTHLTPAMGQILVGGATAQFPSLRNAFFVGDILTKRDCVLLRDLAENVNIINMYGTTETQRAVSYFEIPSRARDATFLEEMPEIIPAGRGMLNVQLLVVHRDNRSKQCTVGEIGEIYVRAAGLAEGYLGDTTLNEQKFVQNWFVDPKIWEELERKPPQHEPWRAFYKGPRDRLYRTGDLGRYLPSGDVECVGRADDQVKIRGFRIELGDINSQLSQQPLIRDCVTLLRRDKVEEPTLVSYVVPEFKKWSAWLAARGLQDKTEDESMTGMLRRFRPLQDELRRFLRGRLPAYAVPTHFIPMAKLPLNPNGKVDKPALPFPDIVEITAVMTEGSEDHWQTLSSTERMVAEVWGSLLQGVNARTIQSDDSFFDLGGHSILAQQMILAVRRRLDGLDIPMALLFERPTLQGFARGLDDLRPSSDGQNGITQTQTTTTDYASDGKRLTAELAARYPTRQPLSRDASIRVFLTGASGFLGAFLLRDLLRRQHPQMEVIAHVRAKSPQQGLQRLIDSCTSYGLWQPSWTSRLRCVTGNLGEAHLGMDEQSYQSVVESVDVVIHNGAQVHWVYPYVKLRPANVQGTIDAMALCATGNSKNFAFVSSTSVLDNDHYVQLSDDSLQKGAAGVLETDDLTGSQRNLSTGYGQSKWVSEYLVREAGKRGLQGVIVRPGYILGDSRSGVTNTDDFLIRLLKGCIQLSSRPQINNTINMVPADHVARVVVASALHPPVSPLGVVQVTSRQRLQFTQFLEALPHYGYNIPELTYAAWRDKLEEYVSAGAVEKDQEQLVLMPLYHFVTNDLPGNTRAPELDDRNAATALRRDADWTGEDRSAGASVDRDTIGRYIRYLCEIGFLQWPAQKGADLPVIELDTKALASKASIGGRGGR